jgi:predicted RNase H-like nuclease
VRKSVVGFDSAWTDRPSAPGAVSILRLDEHTICFEEPELASFDRALGVIDRERERNDLILLALDQPTIVPNLTSMRPVDRVAASIISWAGGGVQPANRSKLGMFDDTAPIWRFKDRLRAIERPEAVRTAQGGLFLIEVFPALALLSVEEQFHGRLKAPRYNPARRKTFRASDWLAVLDSLSAYARTAKLEDVARWCESQRFASPLKADQDKLDSVICALVGWTWLTAPRDQSVMIGDLETGYMISPASPAVKSRILEAASRCGTPVR